MYKKLIEPTEEEVNELLKQGYTLHSVTHIIANNSYYTNKLVYHFIKYVVDNPINYDVNFFSADAEYNTKDPDSDLNHPYVYFRLR